MTEKALERKLKKEVEKLGGLCLKCVTPGFTGIPDRMCLFPGGVVWFVEIKKPDGILSVRQSVVLGQLHILSMNTFVVGSIEMLEDCLFEMNITIQNAI
jgi:hypothetical protein